MLTDFDNLDDITNTSVLMHDGQYVVAGWVNIWPGGFGLVCYLRDDRLDSDRQRAGCAY